MTDRSLAVTGVVFATRHPRALGYTRSRMASSTTVMAMGHPERGAENLAQRCLRVRAGETVHVMTYHAEDVFPLVAREIARAGGAIAHVPLDILAREAGPGRLEADIARALGRATASVTLAPSGAPAEVSLAAARAATRAGARHVHMPRVDARALGQSVRADPDMLRVINDRLAALLKTPSWMSARGAGGTEFEAQFSPSFALVSATGRPAPGHVDNLPSGFVDAHPASVSGLFVADRGVLGPDVRVDPAVLKRAPVRFTLKAGRVASVACEAPEALAVVERYLASHPEAARVGLLSFPTNYLVRSETGHDAQDALLPGVNVCLGFADAARTRASVEAPVQLRLLARKLTVEIRGTRVVTAGRFEDAMVEGIDPFR